MQRRHALFIILLLSILAVWLSAAKALEVTGAIKEVTVYRGQALVTRQIALDLPPGSSEVVVAGLPAGIVSESIYAESPGDTRVLSIRYRARAVDTDTREEVKTLDEEIELIKRRIHHIEKQKGRLDDQYEMFENLQDFTVEAVNTDINRGILTYEPIKNLVDLIQVKGREHIRQSLAFEDEIAELEKDLELLTRKRAEYAAQRSKLEREAVLYLDSSSSGESILELNYLVNGADWLCQYNLRGDPENAGVVIEYNAVINQTSGEDWDGVTLRLSTAQPAMVATAPALEPLKIGLVRSPAVKPDDQEMDAAPLRALKQLRRERASVVREGAAAERQLRHLAAHNQMIELNLASDLLGRMQDELEDIRRVEGISVTYDLPGKLTLPSRSDRQLAAIATVQADADFVHLATPLLTDYVYLQADVLNDSDIVLLPGEASVFRNGQFVGKSLMPAVTAGEKFTTGFGIDPQVQAVRELEDKQTKIQGGNRIDTFKQRITLANYRGDPVNLRLVDRLPYTEDKSIRIDLGRTSHELSDDVQYVRKDKPKGLLRWDLEVPANAIDDRALIVNYSYTAEYDRSMEVQPLENN